MILPTKHMPTSKSVLSVGASVLTSLSRPKTVSKLWDEINLKQTGSSTVTFDWFVLALDFLYAASMIAAEDGVLRKVV
jgi:hypothetical protein